MSEEHVKLASSAAVGCHNPPGVSDDQGAEHGANSSSGAGHSDGGSSSADELGSGVNVGAGGGGRQLAGLGEEQ